MVSTHGCTMTQSNVPITCLNLQSHDTISCQKCCYLIFLNFLVYLLEVENSKYDTKNTSTRGSTTGMNTLFHLHRQVGAYLPAYEDGTDSVPKRRHIKFRHREITQKKAYNIQDTAKV